MRYKRIDKQLFIENRERFVSLMEPNSVAILRANDIMPTNADGIMGFAQNNDLFYLSGIDQEETILMLFPDHVKEELREVLFVKETNDHIKIWDGEKLTKEQAQEFSGIKNVQWVQRFEKLFQLVAFDADTIYLGQNEHKGTMLEIETRSDRFINWCKQAYPLHKYNRVAKITKKLRVIKDHREIETINEAIRITDNAFRRILKYVSPGLKEYEIEAEMWHEFIRSGGQRHAFQPIIGSGSNACALHYVKNDDIVQDSDMILIDFGVCYGNYNSDITRCAPANGKFTDRQRAVYLAVMRCMIEGAKSLRVGVSKDDHEKQVGQLMEKELIDLGLLDAQEVKNQNPNSPLYKKYFMHSASHYLGLDVHDVGDYNRPFEEGMVFTCEPGIYIPEEGIGCRLENDYLITSDGPVNLSESIPLDPDEIEELMADR